MKITKSVLKQLIKEVMINEGLNDPPTRPAGVYDQESLEKIMKLRPNPGAVGDVLGLGDVDPADRGHVVSGAGGVDLDIAQMQARGTKGSDKVIKLPNGKEISIPMLPGETPESPKFKARIKRALRAITPDPRDEDPNFSRKFLPRDPLHKAFKDAGAEDIGDALEESIKRMVKEELNYVLRRRANN